jgi:type I restriction enzyme R subunit
VFCATQAHAALVRDLINQIKKSSDPNYCVRVTAEDGALGEQWLRTFQDNEKTIPTILTTSQKLSTGVNARNVRNIVLMRPINSMIEFKQIIGRGTRLFDGKDYFTIYDFVKAYEHFNDPEWDGEPMEPTPARPRKRARRTTASRMARGPTTSRPTGRKRSSSSWLMAKSVSSST